MQTQTEKVLVGEIVGKPTTQRQHKKPAMDGWVSLSEVTEKIQQRRAAKILLTFLLSQ